MLLLLHRSCIVALILYIGSPDFISAGCARLDVVKCIKSEDGIPRALAHIYSVNNVSFIVAMSC